MSKQDSELIWEAYDRPEVPPPTIDMYNKTRAQPEAQPEEGDTDSEISRMDLYVLRDSEHVYGIYTTPERWEQEAQNHRGNLASMERLQLNQPPVDPEVNSFTHPDVAKLPPPPQKVERGEVEQGADDPATRRREDDARRARLRKRKINWS